MASGVDFFVTIKSEAEMATQRWLEAFLETIATGPALAACARDQPSEGQLTILLSFANRDEDHSIDVDYRGEIAGSLLGECVAKEVDRVRASADPLSGAVAAQARKTVSFPP